MKQILTLTFLFFIQLTLIAHEGGHGNSKTWTINGKSVQAELLNYENDKVFFLDKNHQLISYKLEELAPAQQEIVLSKYNKITQFHGHYSNTHSHSLFNWVLSGAGVLLLAVSLLFYVKQKKPIHLLYGALGCIFLVAVACKNDDSSDSNEPLQVVPSNDVSFIESIFGTFPEIGTSFDDTYFYVSSNGIPDHSMMVGITNWQQQVPIDHNYTGNNSWAIPIQPVLSDNPLSTQTNLLKGAIAIAANGIPIFNPLNNRGEDANAIGELDQWGGHCGRADDYHYHLPPTHLQSIVGNDKPIAYAVDGFPVYGETTQTLDEYLGRFNEDGGYEYYSINEYPYLIAGMRGKVTLDPNTSAPENQVIPQAMTQGVRPALEPLQGAEITDFTSTGINAYQLTYTLNNQNYVINYSWDDNGLYTYEFVNPNGTTTQTYQR
ncbi:YHYH protein [Winogradskyella endarachnes]|uniref:YHYH protein n=1 Tax=Winogradskyella endarachnes TaxID=2681965 RepID=A0A6L6UCM1_9FLAO|nr:YHYH protein [Winogradskyella endarachnes]MUU78682.1 YHYH protein [Winogradskyella endarachnes]